MGQVDGVNNGNLSHLTYSQASYNIEEKVKESCNNPQKTKLGWQKDKPPIFGYIIDRRNESPACIENKNWYNNMQVLLQDSDK